MINIKDKIDCCGCSGCVEICPKKCITFEEDNEGFRYPKVDLSLCIKCGLCEKVCPVINTSSSQNVEKVYAAYNTNPSIQRNSSSGGVFTYLAEEIIKSGGIVFGAKYNESWEVVHAGIEDISDLHYLRNSKYMQSNIGTSFEDAKKQLQKGRKVLFSGTPCQIAGLKKFLRREYDNLYCVDFICHGVPSPKVWRKYLSQLIGKGVIGPTINDITNVNFRSKVPNWCNSQIQLNSLMGDYTCPKDSDPYFNAFNMNVSIRPICYNCPFKGGKSGSDLTIADFWGIKQLDQASYNDNGISMIIDYGKNKFNISNLNLKIEHSGCIKLFNGSYFHSAQYNGNRKVLFGKIDSTTDIVSLLNQCTNPTFIQRIYNIIYRKFSK